MNRMRRQLGGVDRLPSGRYRVRVLDPATRQRVSVGTYRTKAEAEHAFNKAAADQARGGWVVPEHGRVTLEAYADQWLASRLTTKGEPLRPRVQELYESELRLHIGPWLGHLSLNQLNTASVRTWYATMLDEGPGANTRAKCYRLLRAILNTAVEDGLIVANPCTIKGAGVEPNRERSVPSVEVVYALADEMQPRFRALVLLAAFGGLRRGELLGLARRHVDLLHKTVTVERQRQQTLRGESLVGPPKTEAGSRTIAIPSQIVAALDEHLRAFGEPGPDGFVFVGVNGGPLRQHVLQTEWARAREVVGVPELHLHDLRHFAGTVAATTGAGTKELMHRLGHVSPDAALRYQHATRERDKAIADGMDRLIEQTQGAASAPVTELETMAVKSRD